MAQKKSLRDIAQKFSGGIRSKCAISRDIANELFEIFETDGVFVITVEEFNPKVGYSDNVARAWQLKQILNKHYSDILPDGTEWKIGTTDKSRVYKFGVGPKAQKEE